MPTDHELLHDYARHRSESAFTELVQRHVNMVYSAALRETQGDTSVAEDITQAVFTEVARKASRLCRHPALAGWLYTCVRQMSANTRRSEDRRQRREVEAHTMKELLSPDSTESDWRQLQPVLDDAMHELSEADRAVVVLRFFEDRSHSEVGLALGLSDTAARKRVDRALEKLRALLGKRGITSTASGLTAALAFGAIITAPANLAASVAAGAVVATASTAATSFTLLNLVTMTKLQTAIVGAIVVAGVATPLVMQHQAQVRLREQNEALQQQVDQLTPLEMENQRLSNLVAQARRTEPRSTGPSDELLRLRAEVTRLRWQTNELGTLQGEIQQLRSAQSRRPVPGAAIPAAGDDFPRENWAFAGYANPESAVVSLAWAAAGADLGNFLNSMTPEQQSAEREKWLRSGQNDAETRAQVANEFGRTKRIRILGKETLSANEIVLSLLIEHEDGRTEKPRMKVVRIGNEWKLAGPYRPPAQKEP